MTIETRNAFRWSLSDEDLGRLAAALDVPIDMITRREQLVDREAPTCTTCGRTIGALDYVATALARSVHGKHFLETFFTGGDMSKVATPTEMERVLSIEHDVNCFSCGELQLKAGKWYVPMW